MLQTSQVVRKRVVVRQNYLRGLVRKGSKLFVEVIFKIGMIR